MKYWHFAPNNMKLQYSNEPLIPLYTYMLPPETKIIPCKIGFHASTRAIDALQYAPGSIISICTLHGDIVPHGDPIDKYAAHGRTHLKIANVDKELMEFARWCALSVIHLWDAPQVVIDYLNNGDDKLRPAAWSAADSAADSAVWSAADPAAWSATGSAVKSAVKSAVWSEQNTHLEKLLNNLLSEVKP